MTMGAGVTFDFSDRVVVVSGGSGALGGTLVRRFLAAGAVVDSVDRDAAKAERAFADLRAGERLRCHGADLADPGAVARLVEAISAERRRIDHLANAVGAFSFDGPVETAPPVAWSRMLEANFYSVLYLCRAVVPVLERGGGGTIVNVGSRASLAGGAQVAPYAVAKTAVLRLSESLSAEGRRRGIRVNCVLPGTMDTAANRRAMADVDPAGWVPLDAVADAVLFLSSAAAGAIHGAALPVFGLE